MLSTWQLAYNGLTIGDGTAYDLIQVDGLDSMPGVAMNDTSKARDWGEYAGVYFAAGRDVVVDVEVHSTSDAGLRTALDALGAACAPSSLAETALTFLWPGMPQASRQVGARATARAALTTLDMVFFKQKLSLRFHCTDPRIYDSTLQSSTVGLPAGTGGVTWPAAWPISWGSAGVSGTAAILNSGSFASRPVVTIAGPVDNPSISNTVTGQHLTFAITLLATDVLTVDLNQKTVLLNGTANRRATMTSDSIWWELPPGTSTFGYTANTVQVGSSATIMWRSAWM